jgi:transposase InsO family protein
MQDGENNLACKQTKMPKDERPCRKMPQDNERGVLPSERLLAFDSDEIRKYLELDDYYYNYIRPHASLKNKPPMLYFKKGSKKEPRSLTQKCPRLIPGRVSHMY